MSMQPDFRTPLKRAIGLGSAKDGTGHFLWQRITAIALGLCGIYLIGLLLGLTGAEYVFARATVRDPINASVLVAFLIAAFWHAKMGLQVVIEDYVHTDHTKYALLLLNTFFAVLLVVAALYSILKMSFGL